MYPYVRFPGIDFDFKMYGLFVFVGFLVALLIARSRAKRVKADPGAFTTMALLGAVLGFVGCRAMYVAHYLWETVSGGEVGVDEVAAMRGGGEILGGMILASLGVFVYLRVTGKPVRQYLDIAIAPAILAMGIGRLGCFFFGCCFGGVCEQPSGEPGLAWAVRFPYGSPAYQAQWERKQLSCPPELMWVPPDDARRAELAALRKVPAGAEVREPIPRDVLLNTSIDDNKTLGKWARLYRQAELIKTVDEDAPRLDAIRKQMRELARDLTDLTKVQLQLGVHLARLSSQHGRDEPVTMADLRALAAGERSRWVHPTQLYDTILLTVLFGVLSVIYYRRRHDGVVLAWALILYPLNRFIQEIVRADNPRDVGGLTISQFLSIVLFVLGWLYLLAVLRYLPAKSPRREKAPVEVHVTT